ncbi:MAG: hypothetical protein LH606_16600 [Cytophagaceae bacterium]|nr:hypothetical protein [Cytophagaceae bacterium]
MKTRYTFSRALWLGLLLGWLGTGCGTRTAKETAPQSECRIQKIVRTTPGTQTDETTYEYDAPGNLVRTTQIRDGRTVNGASISTGSFTTTAKYTYNAEGFLTNYAWLSSARSSFSLNGNVTTEPVLEHSTNTTYTYANGRVTGYTSKRVSPFGLTTNTTGTYEYDESGNVAKETRTTAYEIAPGKTPEMPAYPAGFQQTWLYRGNQLIDYTLKTANTESHPYTIQNGLVMKSVGPTGSFTCEYDDRQRLVRFEAKDANNQVNHYYTLAWDTGKPATEATPDFKGFPVREVAVGHYGVWGQEGRATFGRVELEKSYQFFANYSGTQVVPLGAFTYGNQTNGRGFPTSIAIESKDLSPGSSSPVTRKIETFTYSNCD